MAETAPAAPAPAHRNVDAPLVSPAPSSGLLGVFRNHYVLKLLVKREISARYQGSVLGFLWSYINPATQLVIYWMIFGILFGRPTENFAVHLFCGLIIVHFFIETLNAGTRSIVRNKSLVRKMAVPREMFPVASMLVSLTNIMPQLGILTVVCLVLGWTPELVPMLGFLLALLLLGVLGTGFALMFSAANVFFRDVGSIVTVFTHMIRFGVPMMYPFTLVEQKFGDLARYYLYNPAADAVLLVQDAFWVGTTSDRAKIREEHIPDYLFTHAFLALGIGLVILVLAQLVFTRLENKIPERL